MNIKEYSMKIMKYTLWATVGLSLLFASCESILDINPKDRLTTKDYFTNEVTSSIQTIFRVTVIFIGTMLIC